MARPITDWRNPANYPKAGARLSLNRWAWEFLRRNTGYQAAWENYRDTVAAILADNEGDESRIEDDPRFGHYEPERLDGEDEAAWRARVKRGRWTPIDSWIAREWGLKSSPPLPDPFASHDPFFISFSGSARVIMPAHWDTAGISVLQPESVFLIDFRKPIDGQIDALRRYAAGHQKFLIKEGVIEAPETKNERPEWPLYLRLLDAELDGVANINEIAPVLYKGQHETRDSDPDSLRRRIEKNQARARDLRDGGYLLIAATAPKLRNNSRVKKGSVT